MVRLGLDAASGSRRLSLLCVMAAAAVFGLSYSLSSPLIATHLEARGYSDVVIGVNASMHALGVLCMAFVLPRLSLSWSTRTLVVTSLLATAGALLLLMMVDDVRAWFVFRFVLGCAAETLFVMTEVWINGLSVEEARGRTLATYTALLSLGMAIGPGVLSVVGVGAFAYVLGAGMAVLAAGCAALPMLIVPLGHGDPVRASECWKLAPLALGATVLNAAVETAGLTFIAPYAMEQGWTQAMGMRLLTCLLVGAVLCQPLVGWVADRMDRRALALRLAVCSAALALVWPLAIRWPVVAFALVFVWGGLFVGIYTVMLTLVGARFRGPQLVGIYSAMGIAWGVGALGGPVLAGVAMSTHAALGLPVFIALLCGAFAVAVSTNKDAS
nr:MFS transporter [Dyella sp. ASV24]